MTGPVTTSAAILAGGRSTRFGGIEKGTLVIEGRSIIERQIAELSTITSDILLVGGPRAFVPSTGRVVPDRVADCGPLGGLCTALVESSAEVTIVIACDMPFVSGALLRYLGARHPVTTPSSLEPITGIIRCARRTPAPR